MGPKGLDFSYNKSLNRCGVAVSSDEISSGLSNFVPICVLDPFEEE